MIRFGKWRRSNAAHARHVVRGALAKLPRHVQLEVVATLRDHEGPPPGLVVSENPCYVFVVRSGKTRTFNAIRQIAWARPDLLGVTFERRWMGERRHQQRSGQAERRRAERRSPDLDRDWVRRGFVLSTVRAAPIDAERRTNGMVRVTEDLPAAPVEAVAAPVEGASAALGHLVPPGAPRPRPSRARRAIVATVAVLILLSLLWWLRGAPWPSDRVVGRLADLRPRAAENRGGSRALEMSEAPRALREKRPSPDPARAEGRSMPSPPRPAPEASDTPAFPPDVSRGRSAVSAPVVPKAPTVLPAPEVPPPPAKPVVPRGPSSKDAPASFDPGSGTTVAEGTGAGAAGSQPRRPESAGPAMVRILAATGPGGQAASSTGRQPAAQRGLGFVVDGRGYVLTHADVIRDGRGLEAALADGRTFAVKQVWRDSLTGVAVLRIDGRNLPALPLGESTGLRVGDATALVGWPTASAPPAVSATIRATGSPSGGNLAIDAMIPPEDVGGPLINARGQVVGIASADARFMDGGSRGTAVPIDRAKSMLRQAQASAPALTSDW